MEIPHKSDAASAHPKLGDWITRCGRKPTPSPSSIVFLCMLMILAIGVPSFIQYYPPPPETFSLPLVYSISAIVVLGCIASAIIFLTCSKAPQVDLYSGGIRFQQDDKDWNLAWQDMDHVEITTIYDTWYSHFRCCVITTASHEVLQFADRVKGDPAKVIDAIRLNAPNVEESEVDLGE